MKKQTYGQLAEKVDQAVAWIESEGVPVGRSRLLKYKQILNTTLTSPYGNPNSEITHGQFLAVAFEAGMLVDVFENFPRQHISVLKSKLRTILKGPEYQEKESLKNAHARNIQYELVLASRLNSLGFIIGFANGEKEDLHFHFNGTKYFCECKRPFSEKGIVNAIRDGVSQLKTRFDELVEKEKGIVAVSVDRVSNNNYAAPVFESFEHADAAVTDHIFELMKKHVHLITTKMAPKIAGMFCSLYTPLLIATLSGDLINYNMDACLPFDHPNTDNYQAMADISTFLTQAIEKEEEEALKRQRQDKDLKTR